MEIESLRREINSIDDNILELLSKRKRAVRKIAAIKKKLIMPIADNDREQQIIERLKMLAKEKRLNEEVIASLYKIIIKNSREEQENNS